MTKEQLITENAMYRKALEEILNIENNEFVIEAYQEDWKSKYPACVGVATSIAQLALDKKYIP